MTVHRGPIWIPKRLGGLTRLLHLASFALASMPVVFKLVGWQPRVVLVVAPGFFCAPVAWFAARLAGAKAWLHIQDFEIDAAFELGLLKQPWLRRLAQRAERVMLRRFDTVSTISSRMLRLLAAKSVPMQKTELLPNWVDASALSVADGSLELRQSLDIAPSQIVGFEKALQQYRLDVGRFPSTEQGLQALLIKPSNVTKWDGPYLEKALPQDPWGNPYVFVSPGEHGDFDISSTGRDGRPGGDALDADITNW